MQLCRTVRHRWGHLAGTSVRSVRIVQSQALATIYDCPKIEALLAEKHKEGEPEFYPTPSCPFYKSIVEFFTSHPDNYRNKSVKSVLANVQSGKHGTDCGDAEDFQANCFAKVAVLVAMYAGKPELPHIVEQAVRVQQNNEQAVKFGVAAARILERVVLGENIKDALASAAAHEELLPEIQAHVDSALATLTTPLTELTYVPPAYQKEMVEKHMALKDKLSPFSLAVWCYGASCGNPQAFTNAIMAAVTFPTFVEGVRANLMAGGDNCSRSMFIGALLAAQGGLDSIPATWRKETARFEEIYKMVEQIVPHQHAAAH